MHVRRDDTVQVTTGNERGKTGKVLRVLPAAGRVVVEGVNLRWKHLRKGPAHPQGGRVRREVPIAAANVLPFCARCAKGVRPRREVQGGVKRRVCRRCGEPFGGG